MSPVQNSQGVRPPARLEDIGLASSVSRLKSDRECLEPPEKRVRSHNFNSTTELKARIISVWNHGLETEILEKLAYSMSDRLRAVVKACGGSTRY